MANNAIAIIGAGAWGTSLAQILAKEGREIRLFVRRPEQAEKLNTTRENDDHLPGIKLHENIKITADAVAAVEGCKIILNAVPTQHIRETFAPLKDKLEAGAVIVNTAKGIEISSHKLISQIFDEIFPDNIYVALSGPTFAEEVAAGMPSAVTLASMMPTDMLADLAFRLSARTLRPYVAHDVAGVEIAGAVKNVIAIACGIVEGKKMGNNAKAALMARGLAEIKRLGLKMGAEAETFLGLSGVGDLTLTCNSQQSRNYSLGFALGEGKSAEQILSGRTSVAEGYYTARAVFELSRSLKVEMPLCEAVYALLYSGTSVEQIIENLLNRNIKTERA